MLLQIESELSKAERKDEYFDEVEKWLFALGGFLSLKAIADAIERETVFEFIHEIEPELLKRHQAPLKSLGPIFKREYERKAREFQLRPRKGLPTHFLESFGGARITAITEETRAGIVKALTEAIRWGENPRKAARRIRGLIGLTERQALALSNHQRSLIEIGLSSQEIEKRVLRLGRRYLRRRAETIARTEFSFAYNRGQLSAWGDAQRQGLVPPTATREWLTAGDDRVCPLCIGLEGERVMLDEPFPGGFPMPPAHPNCRCTMILHT
ncbi:MAG: phage minor head protein [Candidatus Methanosuratincola petrocarbonis]